MSKLTLGNHVGTHIDAQTHFIEDGDSVTDIQLSKLIGNTFVIDLSYKKEREDIDIKDIRKFKSQIEKNRKVIIKTGWYKFNKENKYYSNFPKITADVAKWLVSKKIELLGVESPSLNIGDNSRIHSILLENNVVIVESLARLDSFRNEVIYFVCLPLRIEGLSGSPVRAIALSKK